MQPSTPRLALTALLLVGLALIARPDRAPEPAARESRTEPSDWWFAQRAYPAGEISPDKVADVRTEVLLRRGAPGTSANLGWRQEGPFNIGGRVTALAAKSGSDLLYMGAADGGVWRSTDGGVHWTNRSDGVSLTSIGALALHPGDTNVLLVGTGEANSSVDSYDGNGVWITRDGGATWATLGLGETRRIGAVRFDPLDPSRLYVGAMGSQFSTGPDRGFYRSTDGGATWQRTLFVNDSTGVSDIAVNPVHPDTIYASTWERVRHYTYRRAAGPGTGIWRSTDRGTTWNRLTSGLPVPGDNTGRIALAVAPSRPATVYAQLTTGVPGGYQGLGFYRSTDGGTNWARRDVGGAYTGAFGGFSWYFGAMAVDPLNADRVWALGVSILRSTDGGASWTNTTGSAHVDQHALWVDPSDTQHLIAGNDGGVYRSFDGGTNWSGSNDLPISQFYAGTVAAYDPGKIIGGLQDNNTVLTQNGPGSWFAVLGGDGFVPLLHPTRPDTLYSEFQFCCSGTGLWRSVNNGVSYSSPFGFTNTDRYNWSTPAAMSPTNPNVILVGSQRVYRSTDAGLTYSVISTDLTRALPAGLTFSTISALAISPIDPSLYYVGTDDGRVWRTDNAGGIWIEVTAGLPIRWVTRVVPDPFDAGVVYVTLSGFGQDELQAHVYRSDDRGASWASIQGDLPDLPANDLVPDPTDPRRLYLGTDFGVWTTHNQGKNWYELGAGMPLQAVADLEYHAASRRLFAFTHGRSTWSIDLNSLPVTAPGAPAPERLALSSPAPNPSRGIVHVRLEMGAPGMLEAQVLDVAGRRVRTLERGQRAAGAHVLEWDGRDERGAAIVAGVYYLRVRTGGGTQVRRIVRTR